MTKIRHLIGKTEWSATFIMQYNENKIASRIKIERKALNLSQDAFADALHVNRNTIIAWEKGRRTPPLADMLHMCKLFDCELGYLLCEYDCKTRAATDIQEITGLSEKAILTLKKFKLFRPDAGEMVSSWIADKEFAEIIFLIGAYADTKAQLDLSTEGMPQDKASAYHNENIAAIHREMSFEQKIYISDPYQALSFIDNNLSDCTRKLYRTVMMQHAEHSKKRLGKWWRFNASNQNIDDIEH